MRVTGRGAGHLYRPTYKGGDGSRKTAGIYWWKFRGQLYSTGCRERQAAEDWQIARLAEMGQGSRVGLEAAVLTYEEAEKILMDRHELEGRRAPLEGTLKHLRRHFAGWRAADISEAAWCGYAAQRRAAGAAVATVNLEGARLRRMLRLAWRAGRLVQQPSIPLLPGAHVRRGWLEDDVLERILAEMPAHYPPLILFLRYCGWREGEGLALEWRRVDQFAHEIRLDTSKTGEPRCVPYGALPQLAVVIEEQNRTRRHLCPWVFPAADGMARMEKAALRAAWSRARARAGVGHYLIHDLRRTFVRDCERAGVPRTVAMAITGHRSETIYRRYAIVSARDMAAGMGRLAALEPQRSKVIGSIQP